MAGVIAEAYYGIPEEIKKIGIEKANATIPYYFNKATTFVYVKNNKKQLAIF